MEELTKSNRGDSTEDVGVYLSHARPRRSVRSARSERIDEGSEGRRAGGPQWSAEALQERLLSSDSDRTASRWGPHIGWESSRFLDGVIILSPAVVCSDSSVSIGETPTAERNRRFRDARKSLISIRSGFLRVHAEEDVNPYPPESSSSPTYWFSHSRRASSSRRPRRVTM